VWQRYLTGRSARPSRTSTRLCTATTRLSARTAAAARNVRELLGRDFARIAQRLCSRTDKENRVSWLRIDRECVNEKGVAKRIESQ
jgi:hypothetical protein